MADDSSLAREAAADFLAEPVGVPSSMMRLTPSQAQLAMRQLAENSTYASQALQRGTAAARVNVYLNARAVGASIDDTTLDRLARGMDPEPLKGL